MTRLPLQIPPNVSFELLPSPRAFKEALSVLPPDTSIAIASSASGGGVDRTFACVTEAHEAGFNRICAHLSARLVRGSNHLRELLEQGSTAGVGDYFVAGGDVEQNGQPYRDSYAVLEDIAANHAELVDSVGVAGCPAGHTNPAINKRLTEDLRRKQALESNFSSGMYIETQLDFSSRAIAQWVKTIRYLDIELPINVGLLGAVPIEKAVQAMGFMGGNLDAEQFMKKTHIAPAEFHDGEYIDRTFTLAEELIAAKLAIKGFTIYPLGSVQETVQRYGRVFDAAGSI